MPTLLPAPILGDWSGARVQNLGGGRYQYSLNTGARSLVIACDHLTPGHKITVSIRIRTAAPGKIAVIRIGHSAARAGRGPIAQRHPIDSAHAWKSRSPASNRASSSAWKSQTIRSCLKIRGPATYSVSRPTIRCKASTAYGGINRGGIETPGRTAQKT